MTYCVGLRVDEGLVMLADTRTNAGVDNVATYRKLHIFEEPGERVIAIASAGNLSLSQTVMGFLREGLPREEDGHIERLQDVGTMFQAVQLVGRAIREVYNIYAQALEDSRLSFEVSFLVGGQIKGDDMKLYMVYAAGNAIESTSETPFLQIGEHKYGKPILDRAITNGIDLYDGLKLALISMDSTMRSNLGVGMPLDCLVLREGELKAELVHRIEPGEPYFHDLRERWSSALRAAHMAIPRPPYKPK